MPHSGSARSLWSADLGSFSEGSGETAEWVSAEFSWSLSTASEAGGPEQRVSVALQPRSPSGVQAQGQRALLREAKVPDFSN